LLILFLELWQKTALLVFSTLAFVSAKTKCAFCALGFPCMLPHLVYIQIFYPDVVPFQHDKQKFHYLDATASLL